MRIAIISDTHDRTRQVHWAIERLRAEEVTTVIHCGDIESAWVVELFRGFDAHFVFGNCDLDRDELRVAMTDAGVTLHEPFGDLEIDGKKLAFLHGDDRALWLELENAAHFDYLFHGHTHVVEDRQVGPTRVINPGALHRAQTKTFIILDLASGNVKSLVFPQD